ncbi:MAG TPA: hypothetical protein VFQ45_06660 [Longimicrobium sp.]|nr:hypothetical protein [Longimicrobium sp.]
MSFSLTGFDLAEMLRCGRDLRDATAGAGSHEAAAQAVARYLYDTCRDAAGERECVLVRFYRTHPYGGLEPPLRAFARQSLGGAAPGDEVRCLTLLGTAGDLPAWNSRHLSHGHRAIPLPTVEMVEQAPMIAELVRALGVDAGTLVAPHPEVVRGAEGKSYRIFYVEDAAGSPYIPAQEFVSQHGVRSVVGFGGLMPQGDLFAVILFTRVHVPESCAERFRNVALDLKISLASLGRAPVFAAAAEPGAGAAPEPQPA